MREFEFLGSSYPRNSYINQARDMRLYRRLELMSK